MKQDELGLILTESEFDTLLMRDEWPSDLSHQPALHTAFRCISIPSRRGIVSVLTGQERRNHIFWVHETDFALLIDLGNNQGKGTQAFRLTSLPLDQLPITLVDAVGAIGARQEDDQGSMTFKERDYSDLFLCDPYDPEHLTSRGLTRAWHLTASSSATVNEPYELAGAFADYGEEIAGFVLEVDDRASTESDSRLAPASGASVYLMFCQLAGLLGSQDPLGLTSPREP